MYALHNRACVHFFVFLCFAVGRWCVRIVPNLVWTSAGFQNSAFATTALRTHVVSAFLALKLGLTVLFPTGSLAI